MSSLTISLPNFVLSQSLLIHNEAVRCISVSDDYLLAGFNDRLLILFRYADNKYSKEKIFTCHFTAIYCCFVSADRKRSKTAHFLPGNNKN